MDILQPIYLETKSVDDIQLGDLIELSRLFGVYAHWAVYVGDGDVIHLSPPPSKSKSSEVRELCSAILAHGGVDAGNRMFFGFLDIKVRRDRLKDVANASAIVVNNECDDEMKPFPGKEIVKRAESKLGTNSYNIKTWNCEHFATWCRYGKAVSKQANNVFGRSLSIDAYLVQLPGVELIPPGTLPINVFGIGIPIEDLLTPWAADRRRAIEELKILGEKIKQQASVVKPISAFTAETKALSGMGALMCYLAAPFTFGASLIPAAALTATYSAGLDSSVVSMSIANGCTKDAQSALDADKHSFEKLKKRVKMAKHLPNKKLLPEDKTGRPTKGARSEKMLSTPATTLGFGYLNDGIVVKSKLAAKLITLGQTDRFVGSENATALPKDIDTFVKDALAESNLSVAAEKVLKLAMELEREYNDIMMEDKKKLTKAN